MKLRTIWTITGLPIRERLSRTRESLLLTIAHRLPRGLAYWVLVDQGARYSTQVNPQVVVPEMTFMEVLEGAEK